MEFLDHVEVLGVKRPEIACEIAGFHGIAAVLDWMSRRQLCEARVDIVGQDEFHYDFLIELQLGGDWLAFGVT